MNRILLLIICCIVSYSSTAQIHQYFDGADTNANTAIIINKDPNSNNIWQVGRPQKTIFDSANTKPNALVTDTVNSYPINNLSTFSFNLSHYNAIGNIPVVAVRWAQKIDIDTNDDGAKVEFSLDSGKTWKNAFGSPQVLSFYGFDVKNRDTINTGEYVFSGSDTTWRDVWLCFGAGYLNDSVRLRFSFISDSVNTNQEGWMIDNMHATPTWGHNIKHTEDIKALKVYPTITNGPVTIEIDKAKNDHYIENIYLLSSNGSLLKQYAKSGSILNIDIGNYPAGTYYLNVSTNRVSYTYPIILNN